VPWVVSARSVSALDARVEQVGALKVLSPVDVGFSLAVTGSAMPHRAVLLSEGERVCVSWCGGLRPRGRRRLFSLVRVRSGWGWVGVV
jgi:hypothetical protein